MGFLDSVLLGLETALLPTNLLYCAIGVVLGMAIGVLPGIGALAAISLVFPLTFHMEPTAAVIMLAGIWYGSTFGGAVTAILLNIPGTPANIVTCLDGHPMARDGRAGPALFLACISSVSGGTIGIIILMLFSPLIAEFALNFGPAEYFSLMLLGLIAASAISDSSMVLGLGMMVIGILLGLVGQDVNTGAPRFTFGITELLDGIDLVALSMGLFGVAEVMTTIGQVGHRAVETGRLTLRSMLPTRAEMKRFVPPMLRGSAIGSFFGALPGTGPTIAAYMSYAVEKRIAADPSRFGKGAVEGIVTSESSNNAADQTAFIPTLTLGIPGSATMALMLGAMILHGITPGPLLMENEPKLFWGLVMSFWIGNLMLLILNLPLIGIWVRLLNIPYKYLYPAVMMFIALGTYSISNSVFDLWLVVFFGFAGYAMRILGLPLAPLLLGFVLGPLLEVSFRRALLVSGGDFGYFVSRPLSAVILLLTAAILLWSIWVELRYRKRIRALSE